MAEAAPKQGPSGKAEGDAFRVMLVDDSATVRGLTRRWLTSEGDIEIVASCSNGLDALRQLPKVRPEVIVLDIEMPQMDGLTALPEIFKVAPNVKVIMSSTLTQRNATVSMRALTLGAADYVAKPESASGLASSDEFKRSLMDKVRALAKAHRRVAGGRRALPSAAGAKQKTTAGAVGTKTLAKTKGPATYRLRNYSAVKPNILAIGSSTGGPQALMEVLKRLRPEGLPPVVITQHMPKTFTTILAEHLSKTTDWICKEGATGDILRPGHVYIAPGDYHMLIKPSGHQKKIQITQTAPENFCRPSVDPMFRSLVKCYGPAILGVILTGMGHDGREGSRAVVDAGGAIIGQDEDTSVVWGMPAAVAEGGLCANVLPIQDIASEMMRIVRGK